MVFVPHFVFLRTGKAVIEAFNVLLIYMFTHIYFIRMKTSSRTTLTAVAKVKQDMTSLNEVIIVRLLSKVYVSRYTDRFICICICSFWKHTYGKTVRYSTACVVYW